MLVHSDRGGQYYGSVYRTLLYQHGYLRSQSRRGECLDNAQAESLWSRLKTKELEQHDWPVFRDLADAQQSVASYFDTTTSAATRPSLIKPRKLFTNSNL